MKILELRFKNLNSLYGEWRIDFSDAEYVSNGIFALTGPTGAGKSTILDAVCLALYGATPRLGKITKSENEIMSRQTGECYAEVCFESQAGRFRCHFEQRRARKKADGNLQDPEHQIADADTGKLLETKKSLVAAVIEEKTGMDFDRFKRSILLAQGGFDTFLKAEVEEKSKILEQITGTEIYSEISKRVHERLRGEQDKLNLLRTETAGIKLLDPLQEAEIEQDLEATLKQESALADEWTQAGKAVARLSLIEGLKKEIHALEGEATRLQNERDAFKPERDRLEQAVKAAALEGRYATLRALRRQQMEDQTELESSRAALPNLEAAADTQAQSLASAEQRTRNAKESLAAATPLIQEVRFLDQKLAQQAASILEVSRRCAEDAATIETVRQARVAEQNKRTLAETMLKTVEDYLAAHEKDEWLVGGLAGVEEQLSRLLAGQKEITEKEIKLEKAHAASAHAEKNLDDAKKRCAAQRRILEAATESLRNGKAAFDELLAGRLLREYRTEKDTLLRERAYIKKIEALEDYRTALEDGKACPLCGSTAHPFAEGNVPVPDEIEQKVESLTQRITRAEELEAAVKKLEEANNAARLSRIDGENREAAAANEKQVAQSSVGELKDGLEKLRTGFEELKQAVSKKLLPLGIPEIQSAQVSLLLTSLKSRRKAWEETRLQKNDIEKDIAAVDRELKGLDAVIETKTAALAEKREDLKRREEEHAACRNSRLERYGNRNPSEEENLLNKNIGDAEASEKKVRSANTELQQKLTAAKTHIESLERRVEQRKPDLQKAEAEFGAALLETGFLSETQFQGAGMTREAREALSSSAKELDDEHTALKAKQADRAVRLAAEQNKNATDKTLEESETQYKTCEASLKTLRETIAGLKHTLNENAAAKERIKEKQAAALARQMECHQWEKLHGLIGSADGKKYRNFAQGLTFDVMVSHANRQLVKMTDRYLLLRDDKQPLELNVIDNYQAGEIRSTRNLSGGESFIVSLTLALGLSKMAGRKVRVDSLFLDEGFGTLDEDALETALETLSGLHEDGKLIGVISHVSALKERISTQINVVPITGGKSIIAGPGCRRMPSNGHD